MIHALLQSIQQTLIPLGGIGVFAGSLLEEVIAPIPSALVQMGAGFFLLPSTFDGAFLADLLLVVVIPAAAGVAIGSLLVYFLAYYIGKPAIDRWGKWFGIRWEDVEKGRNRFRGGHADSITLFILRTIPVIPSVAVSAACGLIRMRLAKYLLYTFLGTLIRAGGLAVFGWWAGELYTKYAKTIGRFEEWIMIALGSAVLIFILYRFYCGYQRRHRSEGNGSTDDMLQ